MSCGFGIFVFLPPGTIPNRESSAETIDGWTPISFEININCRRAAQHLRISLEAKGEADLHL
jgi:hypothetical protein